MEGCRPIGKCHSEAGLYPLCDGLLKLNNRRALSEKVAAKHLDDRGDVILVHCLTSVRNHRPIGHTETSLNNSRISLTLRK
jgi:hypothetical protein